MTFRKWKAILLYAVFLFAMMLIVFQVEVAVQSYSAASFHYYPLIVFMTVGLPVTGIIVGLPLLWQRKRHPGKWKVNGAILLFISLLAFVLANYLYIYYSQADSQIPMISSLMSGSSTYIFQLIFGFSLTMIFQKEIQHDVGKGGNRKDLS